MKKLLCELEYYETNPFIDRLIKKGVCVIPVPGPNSPTFTLRQKVIELEEGLPLDVHIAVSPEVIDEVLAEAESEE